MKQSFVHLRLHSEYSIVDGLVRIPDLMQKAVELKMPAIALTDFSNMFALVKFYRAAISYGIKPISGGFRRNHGLRIDLILASKELAGRCMTSVIDKTPRSWERPSDHAPVIAEFSKA